MPDQLEASQCQAEQPSRLQRHTTKCTHPLCLIEHGLPARAAFWDHCAHAPSSAALQVMTCEWLTMPKVVQAADVVLVEQVGQVLALLVGHLLAPHLFITCSGMELTRWVAQQGRVGLSDLEAGALCCSDASQAYMGKAL